MIFHVYIYARTSSSRLPGKVLNEINGEPLIAIVVRRFQHLAFPVRVLTSDEVSDDPLIEWCQESRVDYLRGPLENVAERTCRALESHPCDAFFRVNADSPFVQPDLLQTAARILESRPQEVDLVSNLVRRTYPYGVAVELIRSDVFLDVFPRLTGDECEHITKHFYDRKDVFKISSIEQENDLSGHRLVVDTPQDWRRLTTLCQQSRNLFELPLEELVQLTMSRA